PDQPPASMDGPMHTVTGNRPMAMVTPFGVCLRAKSESYPYDAPIGTISAGGIHHALISGEAFGWLSSFYGQNTDAGLDDPLGTLVTRDRHALVAGVGELSVEDLYFRMLKPHEVQIGMAFE